MKIFAFRIAAALLTASVVSHAAPPPRYYPGPDAPLSGNPLLVGIESAFAQSDPQATLRFPLPETGARLALAAEFFTAYKTALAADPANAAEIVRAARRVVRVSDGSRKSRPVPLAAAALIAAVGEVPAVIPHFGEILDALLDEDPAETVAIATGAIGAAARGGATAAELRNMAHAAAVALVNGFKVADAPYVELTRSILAGTVTTELTGSDHVSVASAIIQGLIRGIRDRGFETVLIDDVARGASRALPFVSGVTIANFASAAFSEATAGRHHAILLAAGFVAGTPFFYLDPQLAIDVAAAGSAARPQFTAEIAAASSHALTIRVNEIKLAGEETLNRIQNDGVNLSDAFVCAALMCAVPTEYYSVLRAGFDGTWGPTITPPATPFLEWLEIALSGNPKFAPDALGQVIDRGNAEGLFVNGITPGAAAGAVLTAGAPLSPASVLLAAQKLIRTGGASELPAQAGSLAAALAATPQPTDAAIIIAPLFTAAPLEKISTLRSAVLGVTDASLRAAIAAAAVIADSANAIDYSTTALAADPSAADNAAISTGIAAAQQLAAVKTQPKWRVAATMRSVISTHPGHTIEAVYGALIGAPKQALPILAAALGMDPAFDLDAALALDPAHAAPLAVAAAIATAEAQNASDPGATLAVLFDTVADAVLAHRTDVESITAAAVIAAPRYAHHTLHAAAFRYPSVGLKIVQATFDAAPITTPGDQTGRAAALAAGLINGLREARSGTKETTEIKLAVGAAVKAARALTGPAVLTSNGEGRHAKSRTKNGPAAIVTGVMSQLVTPGDTKFRSGFVLRAAVGKAPTHALSIAQAAAQAAFSISGTNYNRNSIVLPVADGGDGFSAAQIRNAATFGRSQALALVPGAGAAGVRNYQHRSGATDPIASLEGL